MCVCMCVHMCVIETRQGEREVSAFVGQLQRTNMLLVDNPFCLITGEQCHISKTV